MTIDAFPASSAAPTSSILPMDSAEFADCSIAGVFMFEEASGTADGVCGVLELELLVLLLDTGRESSDRPKFETVGRPRSLREGCLDIWLGSGGRPPPVVPGSERSVQAPHSALSVTSRRSIAASASFRGYLFGILGILLEPVWKIQLRCRVGCSLLSRVEATRNEHDEPIKTRNGFSSILFRLHPDSGKPQQSSPHQTRQKREFSRTAAQQRTAFASFEAFRVLSSSRWSSQRRPFVESTDEVAMVRCPGFHSTPAAVPYGLFSCQPNPEVRMSTFVTIATLYGHMLNPPLTIKS